VAVNCAALATCGKFNSPAKYPTLLVVLSSENLSKQSGTGRARREACGEEWPSDFEKDIQRMAKVMIQATQVKQNG
jgi:hypothetical protein